MTHLREIDHGSNKNAFQYDAYHPLVARIFQHALLPGGGSVPAQQGMYLPSGGVYLPGGSVPAQGVYLPGGTCPGTTPRGQTDTCKNISFANFVCGR